MKKEEATNNNKIVVDTGNSNSRFQKQLMKRISKSRSRRLKSEKRGGLMDDMIDEDQEVEDYLKKILNANNT